MEYEYVLAFSLQLLIIKWIWILATRYALCRQTDIQMKRWMKSLTLKLCVLNWIQSIVWDCLHWPCALKPFVYSNFLIFITKATHMQPHRREGRHLLSLHLASPLKITMQRTQKLRFQMNEFRLHNWSYFNRLLLILTCYPNMVINWH